jgi:DNA-binding transcriptional MerR regulator
MAPLPIGVFAEACNDLLAQLNQWRGKASTVTPRTIRYYTQEGLLPAPALEHGQARYGYEHLLRVVAVKLQQTQFIPLRLISRRLAKQGKSALEQLITDVVLNRNGVLAADAVADSALPKEGSMISSIPFTAMITPEVPPQVPIDPGVARTLSPAVPIVYDNSPERTEYRVLTRNSLEATGLEADLNALGREGWWLVQILPQEKRVLLVVMRRA